MVQVKVLLQIVCRAHEVLTLVLAFGYMIVIHYSTSVSNPVLLVTNIGQRPDPNGILGFTVQELQAAEDAGQRAWIIAHMPPGGPDTLDDQVSLSISPVALGSDWWPSQSNYFDQIIQRYRNTIAGQFYGHSHQVRTILSGNML